MLENVDLNVLIKKIFICDSYDCLHMENNSRSITQFVETVQNEKNIKIEVN